MSAVVPLAIRLRRALAAQAVSAVGDVPLAGVCAGAMLLSASIAASVPADIAAAPDDVKALVAVPLATVLAVYSAVLAAIYGSFRYTVDRRAGVVAQRSTVQPRPWALVGRLPFTALGGVLVAGASVLGVGWRSPRPSGPPDWMPPPSRPHWWSVRSPRCGVWASVWWCRRTCRLSSWLPCR